MLALFVLKLHMTAESLRRMDRTSSGKKFAYCAVMKDRRAISTFTLIKNVYIFQTVTDICMTFKHLIIIHKTAHWQFLKVLMTRLLIKKFQFYNTCAIWIFKLMLPSERRTYKDSY